MVTQIELTVARRGEEHSSRVIESPTLDSLTETLSDLYACLGCEAPGREVSARVVWQTDDGGSRTAVFYAEEPEMAAEEIAAELWSRIVPS